MPDFDDHGKIWVPGSVSPEYGVRVGTSFFIIGKEDPSIIHCFVSEQSLLADIHDSDNQCRIIRRFPLDLEPWCPGSLFSGFKNTKHADIKAVAYGNDGVEEFILDGERYSLENVSSIDSGQFLKLTGWNL